jgi:hypothetical protein
MAARVQEHADKIAAVLNSVTAGSYYEIEIPYPAKE